MLKARHPKLRKVTFQEASGVVLPEGPQPVLVENDPAQKPSNCFHCERPIRRPGYLLPCVRQALKDMGVDPERVIDRAMTYLPLDESRVRQVPEGRALNVNMPRGRTAELDKHTHARVGVSVCCDECSLAHVYSKKDGNMNQCVALASIMALRHGLDLMSLVPAPAKGRLWKHGGPLQFKDMERATKSGKVVRRIDHPNFQQMTQVFQEHHVGRGNNPIQQQQQQQQKPQQTQGHLEEPSKPVKRKATKSNTLVAVKTKKKPRPETTKPEVVSKPTPRAGAAASTGAKRRKTREEIMQERREFLMRQMQDHN